MSYHYTHRDENRELALRFGREVHRGHSHGSHHHHAHYPTCYIVNDGKMIADDKALKHSNTIIYNSPGSTLWIQPSSSDKNNNERRSSSSSSSSAIVYEPRTSYYSSSSHHHTPTCRGCHERRSLYFGSYCRDCVSDRLDSNRRYDTLRETRRVIEIPERRAVGWR
ncbi:hypothetical protein F4778DRAFT_727512 [Xylariomycetidae sp. FL2044]|nr:hypothetical protein F4778DRAFT_727512 [Xylariomycetidae sp. FL2044]